jgi:hypothetical protein
MAFSRRFVQGLRVQQLPSHLDLQLLFNAMEHSPASLSVSYGQRCVGMDYDRAAFGASLADCRWVCCRCVCVRQCFPCQSCVARRKALAAVPAATAASAPVDATAELGGSPASRKCQARRACMLLSAI